MDPIQIPQGWLEQHALPQIIERGQAYYQKGRILRVIGRPEGIQAEVQGSRKYRQHLRYDDGGDLVANCTCPYGNEGICKHLVAVIMALEDGHVQWQEPSAGQQEVPNDQYYEDKYRQQPVGLQEEFLRQVFAKSPQWRLAFDRYLEHSNGQHEVDMREIREVLRESLLELDVPPTEVEAHLGRRNDEQEVAEAFLRRALYRLFKPYQDHLQRRLRIGDWLNAHRIWLAMYEGTAGIQHAAHLDLLLPEEYGAYLRWEFHRATEQLLAQLSQQVIGPAMVRQLVQLFTDQWSFYETQAERRVPPIRYEIQDFEIWLMALAADRLSARFLSQRLQAYQWPLPRLQARLAAVLRE